MNSTHKLFFSFMAACMVGAFVQSSYAGDMGEKEKKVMKIDKRLNLI